MGMAQLVVTAVLVEGRAESEVARDYGISRRWVFFSVGVVNVSGELAMSLRTASSISASCSRGSFAAACLSPLLSCSAMVPREWSSLVRSNCAASSSSGTAG
jgi:hypothetical protein